MSDIQNLNDQNSFNSQHIDYLCKRRVYCTLFLFKTCKSRGHLFGFSFKGILGNLKRTQYMK